MSQMMKALVKLKPEQGIWMDEVPVLPMPICRMISTTS